MKQNASMERLYSEQFRRKDNNLKMGGESDEMAWPLDKYKYMNAPLGNDIGGRGKWICR